MLVCKNCGSKNIQSKEWTYVNTGKSVGDSDYTETQDNWCEDCEENPEFIEEEEYNKLNKNKINKLN